MALFEDFSKKLKEAGQSAAKKTRELTEITKSNTAISEEEKAIRELFRRIGELYYQRHSEDPEEEFSELVSAVNAAKEKIEELRKRIESLKGIERCPECGSPVPADAAFCPSCGAVLPKSEGDMPEGDPETSGAPATKAAAGDVPQSAGRTCKSCGAVMPDGLLFCTECGTKLD